MFEELAILKKKLDSYRPLDSNKMAAIGEKLRIEWTYNSNAIEGNTLSLSETAFFLREGLTSKGKPLSEYLEARNHAEAIDYLDEIVKGKRSLTEGLIKEYHALIMKDTEYIEIGTSNNRVKKKIEPGKYKYDNNHVLKMDGAIHYFCDYLQVSGEMERLIKWYNENKDKLHPVELSAIFHHKFVAIHPFTDGNGRVGRLILNTILMQEGYTPAIIRMEDRKEYYQSLDGADKGDYALIIEMVEREVTRTITLMLNVIEGRDAFSKEDLKRRLGIFEERIEKLDKDPIGVVSKVVDEEKRRHCREQIYQFLEKLAKEMVEENKSGMMGFRIRDLAEERMMAIYEMQREDIEKRELERKPWAAYAYREERIDIPLPLDIINKLHDITQYLKSRNIIVAKKTEKARNANILQIKLISGQKYIPQGILTFVILPTRFTTIIAFTINIPRLENDKEVFDTPQVINHIQGSVLWEDWDKKALEDFFVEIFNKFLKHIEIEIEKRRIPIS
ncbi:Fic family protein [Candidatus Desantisbacteria bacterium]|nr:Fic family protein [Candidatus Desantisbacteria bacterium]